MEANKRSGSTSKKNTPQMDRKIGGKRIRNVADTNDAKKSGRSIIKIKSINDDILNPENPFRSADVSSKVSIQGQSKARGTKKT